MSFASVPPNYESRIVPTPWDFWLTGLLPVFACYYALAVLVLLPNTRLLRLALGPVALYLTYHTATCYDLDSGHQPGFAYSNYGLVVRPQPVTDASFNYSESYSYR
jgi:hypothetical protein